MQTQPQDVVNSTYADALASGCDMVQYKYKGRWGRLVLSRGQARVYGPTGDILTEFGTTNDNLVCVLIGDLFAPPLFPQLHFTVWDCWATGSEEGDTLRPDFISIDRYPYRDRLGIAKQVVAQLGSNFNIVKSYQIVNAPKLWNALPASGDMCSGLIYRKSSDPVSMPVRVARWYKEMPGELP